MAVVIFLIVIILASAGALVYLIYKRLPDIRNLDIDTILGEKHGEAKVKILEAKLSRSGKKINAKLTVFYKPLKSAVYVSYKRAKNKILSLEAKYRSSHEKNIQEPARPQSVEEMVAEAKELLQKEDFTAAEKKLIEVIAKEKKNIAAYELLGQLYFNNRSYDQAEEIYNHLIKLKTQDETTALGVQAGKEEFDEQETEYIASLESDSKVASYYDDLAEIYKVQENHEKALDAYLKAAAIEPNNPKYLDNLIELSIKVGDRDLARQSLRRLKKINPENAKLEEFAEAIEKV